MRTVREGKHGSSGKLCGVAVAFALVAVPAFAGDAPGVDPGLKLSVFADAYTGTQASKQGSPQPGHRAYASNSPAYTAENGTSLSFVGLDLGYEKEQFGATASLRFGPSVVIYHGNSPAMGIDNLVQGYVTWKPADKLTLDLGQFGTIYGAEVAESWNNLNYTRGGLNYLMQPFWHTGLRANYAASDSLSLTLMVVNGVNNISEDDEKPSIGFQVGLTPNDTFSVVAGGLYAVDPETDPLGFDLFFDVVATISLDALTLVANFDFNQNKETTLGNGEAGDASFFGGSLAVGYAVSDMVGVAGRYEYLSDSDGVLYGVADGMTVQTVTGTLDLKPVEKHDNLVLRLDVRYETASEDIFADGDGKPTAGWWTSVIGLVVHADVIGG